MTAKPQPLRADAERNRQRLLQAASELFADRGLGVTLNDIAHYAGVGVGTAYRRFPNKEAVIEALFEQRLEEVAAVAQEALAASDAWQGIVTFMERSMEMQFGDRGLTGIMNHPGLDQAEVNKARDRIAPLIKQLIDRAVRDGAVRPDLDQTDLVFLQVALTAIMDRTRDVAPDVYHRYLTLILDGIRTDRRNFTRLPARALTAAQTHRAMTRDRRQPT